MKIASWNVNSIRVREQQVLDWLAEQQPDVLGLQEIKMPTEDFPAECFAAAGYQAAAFGQRTYNGVALLSRTPPDDVEMGLPGFPDEQRRVIAGSVGDLRVVNVYVPNGQAVGTDKFSYKLDWLAALREYLEDELVRFPNLLVMGDFNIAPDDRDVHDPEEWQGKVLCSESERSRLRDLFDIGLADSFRLFEQPEKVFSWWDYRAAAFRRKRGLRIDLVLVSQALAARCTAGGVDEAPRRLERPSDHAPVFVEFES